MTKVAARYLLDSNIAIYLLDGDAPAVARKMAEHPKGEIVLSAICLAEIRVKIEPRHEGGLAMMLANIPVVDFDAKAAAIYGGLPFKRRSFDQLIAAHALSLGLVVVTANISDFVDVPGLRAENWARA